jgi:hypothetical protein
MKSMTGYTLDTFIEDCRKKISECQSPADCVVQYARLREKFDHINVLGGVPERMSHATA